MEMSANVMDSIDLQNGVFEEEGMKMLEEWENKSSLMLPSKEGSSMDKLDLKEIEKPKQSSGGNYDSFFNS